MVEPRAVTTFDASPATRPTRVPAGIMRRPSPPWGLPELAAIAQVAGPALLYLPGTQAFRAPIRFSVFGVGLLGLALGLRHARTMRGHPSWTPLALVGAYMGLMILHPSTNTTMAGLAQVGMHLAIASPVFWAPRYFRGDLPRLARLVTILWVLNSASAVVGLLQVRDPATWMPAEFSSSVMGGRFGLSMYQYSNDEGKILIRPPGLGDAPGAACGAGLFVASVGMAYLGLSTSTPRRLLGLATGVVGLSVIFLTHVRSSFLVLTGSAIIYLGVLTLQRRARTAIALAVVAMGCGLAAFQYAASLGGKSIVDRFSTLLSADPLTIYERSGRSGMVVGSLDTLLLDYPLGAGLGRWGMMRSYFGDESNTLSPGIWAEVQFASWVLDGGIVVLSLYLIALIIAIRRLLWLSVHHPSPSLRQWAGAITMLSAAPVALIFSYTPFHSQMGLQFWLLIGALEGVARGEEGGR